MEGVRDGFELKLENMKANYENYLANSDPKVDEGMKNQLKSIGQFLREFRKARSN